MTLIWCGEYGCEYFTAVIDCDLHLLVSPDHKQWSDEGAVSQ